MGRRRRKTAGWHCTFQLCTFNIIIRLYSRQLRVQSGDEQAPQNRALTVSAERLGREHLRISSDLVAQHDGFGNNLHGFALLAALALQDEIGLLLAQAQIALQNAFGTFDDLSGLQLFREGGVGFFQARQLKFGAHEKSYGGDHTNLATAVHMVLAMLEINDAHNPATAHQGYREKRLIAVFRQLVEELETWIVRCLFWNGNGFAMLSDPSGDALADAQFQAVHDFRMRILRSPQDEFITFKHVDQAGIALDQRSGKFDHAGQNVPKSVRCS